MTKKPTVPRKPKPPSKPKVRMSVQMASCEIFASMEMVCPLCHLTIPPNTPHRCEMNQ